MYIYKEMKIRQMNLVEKLSRKTEKHSHKPKQKNIIQGVANKEDKVKYRWVRCDGHCAELVSMIKDNERKIYKEKIQLQEGT